MAYNILYYYLVYTYNFAYLVCYRKT